ncbi:MAG TPA: TonB-dependent receptor [Longimicrobiales bacterium]
MQMPSPRQETRIGRRLALLLCASLALTPAAAFGQQVGTLVVRTVNGQTGEPLAGVYVVVRNTGRTGVTDNEGRLVLLNVPAGPQVIVAQLIGYGEARETVTVPADNSVVRDIRLFSRAVELEGVVVTGTALAAQRREIGNSIALITADQIERVAAMNFEDVLRGRAVGLSVTGSPGQAGAGSDILLRGVNSVNGRNAPLIYVDGVRIPSDLPEAGMLEAAEHATFLGSLNPQDIERVEIIKGPAASTLYGTEASAGVIQIFTKRGQAGPPRWTFSMQQGLSRVGHVGPEMDPTGLHINDCTRTLSYDTVANQFRVEDIREPGCPSSGSWLRTAHIQDYRLSVRGGSNDVTYYLSAGWNRSEGVIDPQNARQWTLRGNLTFNGFRNLQISFNNMYSRRDIRWIPNGDNSEGLLYNVARGAEGETPDNNDAVVLNMELDQFINHFNTGANINWTPRDNLRHRLNIGLDFSNSHFIEERPWQYYSEPQGTRAVDVENRRLITLDYAASWFQELPADITSTLSIGGQYNQNEHLGLRGDTEGFLGPGDKVLQNGETDINQEDRDVTESGGFFIQEQIGWRNRLFVTGGFRADAHSAFGNDYRRRNIFTIYPKLQATYTLSDHEFWPDWWETFRLRAAYGESGDPPGEDDAITIFEVAGADENRNGFIMFNQGNQEIGPEITKEIEIGLDASLFNGRLVFSGTAYRQRVDNGRIFIDPPPSNGIAENIPLNVGVWESKGFEGALDVVLLERDAVRVSTNARYQYNKTMMLELGAKQFDSFNYNYLNQYRRGYPMPSLFGRKLLNGDSVGVLPQYSTEADHWYGTTRPPHEISLGLAVTLFNRLTLEAFGVGQYGHVLYDDLAQEMATDGLWPPCIPINIRVERGDIAGLRTRDIARCSQDYAFDEDWVEKADYFRLQTATLSYRVPERFLPRGTEAATLQFQATNLFVITDFSGLYPDALIRPVEQTARGAGYILPPPRTFTLGIRLNF